MFFYKKTKKHLPPHIARCLLPTESKERGVLGFGSIPVAILPSCQYMTLSHHNRIESNTVGL